MVAARCRDFFDPRGYSGVGTIGAIELDPTNAPEYSNRSDAYFRKNQLYRAMTDVTKAIAMDPNILTAYNNRAQIYEAKGQKALAEITAKSKGTGDRAKVPCDLKNH